MGEPQKYARSIGKHLTGQNKALQRHNRKENEQMTIPTMVSIKEASRQTGISYEFIRQLIRERKIIYVRAGVKFLVNMESLVEYLSTGEQHDSAADQERA
nr:MAG TPA: DNA binding domain protein [Caudoviricetes sp.]